MSSKSVLENIQNLVSHGVHIVQAVRQSLGYSIDELAVVCGLTTDEITLLENSNQIEPSKLARITNATGFKQEAIAAIMVNGS